MSVLVASSLPPNKLPFEAIHVQLPSQGWSYGELQKAACRAALEGGHDWLLSLTPGTQLRAQDWRAIDEAMKASSPSMLTLGPTINRQQAGRSWKRRIYAFGARVLGTILGESNVQDYLLDYTRQWRLYPASFLKRVPFELNTRDLWFDIQLLFQAYALGLSVREAQAAEGPPGPERYFRSRYAWNVLMECLRFRAQKVGFLASMRYRGLLFSETQYQDKTLAPGSTHALAAARIAAGSQVVDLGCGPGHVARTLKSKGCTVIGADLTVPASFEGDRFIQMNLETDALPSEVKNADHVLLLDVVEHLTDPEGFLLRLSHVTDAEPRPVMIFSTGNVAFIGVRLALGIGWFNYGERGILDVTHRRLFTVASFRRLLEETGFEQRSYRGVGVPLNLLFPNRLGLSLSRLSTLLATLWPSLWAYQLLIEARPTRKLRLTPFQQAQEAPQRPVADRNDAADRIHQA